MRVATLVLAIVMLLVVVSQAVAKDVTVSFTNVYGTVVMTVPDPNNEAPDGVVRPYSHLTNYMSIAGFVRWNVWEAENRWITLRTK
jgi:hypothetical protein